MLKLYSSLINRYVLTRWVEKLIPLRRLTTIAMPHRGPRASLRQAKKPAPIAAAPSPKSPSSDYRRMSAIQILKSGLGNHMWKKQGWLYDLLKREGIVDGSKQSRKEYCWQYYKSQLLYIEAMQEAKNDSQFDPRTSHHITGKDGRFTKKKMQRRSPKTH